MFQSTWLRNPIFRDWIQNVPNRPGKAFCKYCECLLYAHRFSVLKHATTWKHHENAKKYKNESKMLQGSVQFRENVTTPTSTVAAVTSVPEKQSMANISTSIEYGEVSEKNDEENVYEEYIFADHETDADNFKDIRRTTSTTQDGQKNTNDSEAYNFDDDGGSEETCSIGSDIVHYSNGDDMGEEQENNDWPKTCSKFEEVLLPPNQSEILEMESTKNIAISTHILDTTRGQPAANVPVTLFRLENNEWKQLSQSTTNSDGRCPALTTKDDEYVAGYYKLHFGVSTYFKQTTTKFLYPFIEIVFQCEGGQDYHIPLLLNPFGYSTYRGS